MTKAQTELQTKVLDVILKVAVGALLAACGWLSGTAVSHEVAIGNFEQGKQTAMLTAFDSRLQALEKRINGK